ncbi:MAG TPA: hypothetical protein VL463_30965 [Kofleriaceae bacterium]|jgi:hypothetical protein|nr:hypothetical protein [Kofleriaceae bacterium]
MVSEDPVPVASLVIPKARPRWPLYVAGVGLACTLVPFHCSVNVGSTHQAWDHGGALFGGVVAILFAGYALLRGARRGPLGRRGNAALVMLGLGAAAAIYGYLTIERVGGTIDASAQTAQLRAAFTDDRGVDALLADAGGELRARSAAVHRMVAALRRRFGNLAGSPEWTMHVDDQGIRGLETTAKMERGSLVIKLAYRADHLVGIHVDIPAEARPKDPSEARTAAMTLATDLAAGAIDRFHDEVDPMMEIKPEFEELIRQVHAHAGDAPQIDVTDQRACGEGYQCFDLHLRGASLDQTLKITEASTYGLWLATDVTFVKS